MLALMLAVVLNVASGFDGYKKLPRFPDGRIDYTHSRSAPVISCVIEHSGKILIVKRSMKVMNYKGAWDIITGYIDNPNISNKEHAILELEEELGINADAVMRIDLKKPFRYFNSVLNRTYIVFPVLVRLKSEPKIKLNWENTSFRWIYPKELGKYNTIPDLDKSVSIALNLPK